MKLIVLGQNHKTATIAEREGWTVSKEKTPPFLHGFLTMPGVHGAVYLSTCNRVEVIAAVQKEIAPSLLIDYWKEHANGKGTEAGPSYIYSDERAFGYLVRVACGLDSLAMGETQILGQIKQAYLQSLELKTSGALLNSTFQKILQIAKKIRTETGITRCPTSISSVAVMLAEQIFGDFEGVSAMVVGLGEVGRQTAALLHKRGIKNLMVTNRTYAKAQEFLDSRPLDASPFFFHELETKLNEVDLVITCTSSPTPILTKEMLRGVTQKDRPMVLVDLGVPRDIASEAGEHPGIYLYNIDDLKTIAAKNISLRKEEALLAERIIQEESLQFVSAWKKRTGAAIGPFSRFSLLSPSA